jgi:hypothetical protein
MRWGQKPSQTASLANGPGNAFIGGITVRPDTGVLDLQMKKLPALGTGNRILAAIHPPQTTRIILEHLGLPARAAPVAAATADEAR